MAVWVITRMHSTYSLNLLYCGLEENNKIETPPDEKRPSAGPYMSWTESECILTQSSMEKFHSAPATLVCAR